MRKNFLSILLVLALCLSMFPTIALADEHTKHADSDHDHKCDICKKAITALCIDNNEDHRCDTTACGILIAGACKDDNKDH